MDGHFIAYFQRLDHVFGSSLNESDSQVGTQLFFSHFFQIVRDVVELIHRVLVL